MPPPAGAAGCAAAAPPPPPPKGWSIKSPSGVNTRAIHGFGVGTLLTGDPRYADTWRGVIDYINNNAREIDGKTKWPNAYGDYFGEEDWYDWKDTPFSSGAMEVWYWS